MTTIDELNQRFEIEGVAGFDVGEGGLARLRITVGGLVRLCLKAGEAEAHVYPRGAHLTHWQPAGGKPVLWVSERSRFEEGMPIRGGVPICWPWFGPCTFKPELGNHGFVRKMAWEVESITQPDPRHVAVTLRVSDTDQTLAIWPHEFELRLTITVGADLTMALEARNVGDAPFTFTEAFHPYLCVADIRKAAVTGLADMDFIDLRDGGRCHDDHPRLIFTEETDREYVDTQATTILEGGLHWGRITISKSGSDSTVVWNPWTAKAREMSDFGDDEWPEMVCVEPANAATRNAVTVAAGEKHTMAATFRVDA